MQSDPEPPGSTPSDHARRDPTLRPTTEPLTMVCNTSVSAEHFNGSPIDFGMPTTNPDGEARAEGGRDGPEGELGTTSEELGQTFLGSAKLLGSVSPKFGIFEDDLPNLENYFQGSLLALVHIVAFQGVEV